MPERTVEFRFSVKLDEKTAEGQADLFLRDLKPLISHFASAHLNERAFGFCAVIKPDDMSREFGAQNKIIR